MTELFDTHCHLDMNQFKEGLQEVIQRARSQGVKYILTIGTDIDSSQRAVEIASRYEGVYASVGIHPHDAKEITPEAIEQLRTLAERPEVVAIGETGLDYHYEYSPRQIQIEAFREHIALAEELNLPLIVHSRKAKEDTLEILKQARPSVVVMHCFSGDKQMLRECLQMNCYISIAGPVTFKNAKNLQDIALEVPDERLLIETDAPYLTPVPFRGRTNEPAYVFYVAEKLASLRGVTVEDIARITTLNARRVFLPEHTTFEPAIAYKIRNSLYLNITNRCSNACTFCVRFHTDFVKGYNLRLSREPDLVELKEAIGNPKDYDEIVFCGYGEPLLRLDLVKALARWIKDRGGRVRINTNGQGNLIHGRNILPELKGLVDRFSISLNAPDEETYNKICQPFQEGAFQAVVEFIREAVRTVPEVTVTVVEMEGLDIEACKKLASELGARFKVRYLDRVG